ncbi:MAG TPA: YbaB/EbfC family nucleoid-associated protein [Candidatus Paceibacterota bacterium]|nr:YbaB/EbfC family nucleoid-associated protein [Candidatus Paceibacterota bacterium]
MGFLDKLKDVNEMRKQGKQLELMLANEEVTGKSSGDKIKITVDGNQKVKSVEVDASVAGDKSEVARHIRQALEDLTHKHKKMLQSKFGSMMGS